MPFGVIKHLWGYRKVRYRGLAQNAAQVFTLQLSWLDSATEFVDENDATEDQPHTRLLGYTRIVEERDAALKKLRSRLPGFVYFNI